MDLKAKSIHIVIAEDDEEDRMLTREAMIESRVKNTVHFVEDGEYLMDYLHNKGDFSDKSKYPAPGLILLDLNMPRKDGREALKEIKSNEHLKRIPVVILTTSKAEEDIIRTYNLGVNSFITKPVTFEGMINVMKTLGTYWLDIVELPANN
ncbi:MAG: response regulator [Bacteroidia bacterium]|nr:response regulator [Bacteroidia bacterium]